MSALANWYPGHWVLDFCVIAATTVILVTATGWMVSLFLKRHPAIRHGVLLSALVAALPNLAEVSIGHAIIADALTFGMAETVRLFREAIGDVAGAKVRIA